MLSLSTARELGTNGTACNRQLGIFKHFKGLEQLDFYYHCYSDQEPPQKSHDCVKGFFERKYARDSTRTMPRIDWYNILFCP